MCLAPCGSRHSAAGSHRRCAQGAANGLSLVELLVVVAVLALLAAVGTPLLSRLVDSTRLSSYANDFLAALHLARSEAIKRRERAGLCKSADGVSCSETGGWEQGWIVFRDANSNGLRDDGELVVQYTARMAADFRFSGNATVAAYISYVPTGRTRLAGGGFQAGTLTLCKVSDPALGGRQIVINSAGRARVSRVNADSCI